jgi:Flp pilus assembly protein TadG
MNLLRKRFARAVGDCEGATAVEFALIAPAMILLFLGIIVFSLVLSTYSALQQIAAEAARAALPGQTATQQAQLASQYVSGVVGNYSFINPAQLTVATSTTSTTFGVSLTYNASGSFFSTFGASVVSVPIVITRSATIQLSGF